jgi:hypothetical protein
VTVTSRGDRVTEGALVASDGTWIVVRGDDGALNTLARTAVEAVRLADRSARFNARPTLEATLEGARGGRLIENHSPTSYGFVFSASTCAAHCRRCGAPIRAEPRSRYPGRFFRSRAATVA